MTHAYLLGHNAYRAGMTNKANPFKYPSWDHDEFYLGWYTAKQAVEMTARYERTSK